MAQAKSIAVTNQTVAMAETTSAKNVSRLVRAASAAYGKAQSVVQEAGLAIISHASLYGDCSQATALARAVPARERNSLIGWFSLYSPIGIALGKSPADDRVRFIKRESNNYHDFNIDGAKANPWFNDPAKANPEPKPLNTLIDFYATIDRMLKKAIKDAEADAGKSPYDEDFKPVVKHQAEDLLKLVNQYRAKHIADKVDTKDKGAVVTGPKPTAMAA